MADKKAVCTLTDVEKRYVASMPALGPVSMQVHKGEILGIRGLNGAGKSTLLGVMAGVLRPDRGCVSYAPEAAGRIGYVPQELSLYTDLSGLQNLRFWGLASGLPAKALAVRSRWLLEQMELTDRGRKPVSTYSGGMKRRLHLASALMARPELLLLDEPTVGADAHSVRLILDMLQSLKRQGSAVAFISHRAGELEQVCDRIVTLERGLLTEEMVLT